MCPSSLSLHAECAYSMLKCSLFFYNLSQHTLKMYTMKLHLTQMSLFLVQLFNSHNIISIRVSVTLAIAALSCRPSCSCFVVAMIKKKGPTHASLASALIFFFLLDREHPVSLTTGTMQRTSTCQNIHQSCLLEICGYMGCLKTLIGVI